MKNLTFPSLVRWIYYPRSQHEALVIRQCHVQYFISCLQGTDASSSQWIVLVDSPCLVKIEY
jgi:hypothetical protein